MPIIYHLKVFTVSFNINKGLVNFILAAYYGRKLKIT